MKRPATPIYTDISMELAKVEQTPWEQQNPPANGDSNGDERPEPLELRPELNELVPQPIDYASPTPKATSSLRLCPDIVEPERWWKRWLFLLIAVSITAAFGFFLYSFFAPAPGRPGIDENGYLVGGKNIAQRGTMAFTPTDDYQFVGAMWVRTKDETHVPGFNKPAFLRDRLTVTTKQGSYYPKYPLGTSLLYAMVIWAGGGDNHGREWAFLINPLCTTLAVLGMFMLARAIAGSFYAVLAMIILATGQTLLLYSVEANSHTPSVCLVIWGMFFLLRWTQTGSWWRGLAAGFLLGAAVTVRYTEALLLFPLYPLDQFLHDTVKAADHPRWWQVIKIVRLLPIGPLGLAVIFSIRWLRPSSYLRAILPLIAWAIPVSILVTYNWFTLGHITGYDQTNESIGFSVTEFLTKWDFTVQQLYAYGLFMLLPLGIAGLALMYRRSWRAALFLTLWFLPGTLLYNAYYWGRGAPGVAFTRFFLTLFPPVIIASMWLLRTGMIGASVRADLMARRWGRSIAGPVAGGLITAAAAAIGLTISLPELERQHRGNMNLNYSAHVFQEWRKIENKTHDVSLTTRPVVFADEGLFPQFLQYMQFMTDCDWYTVDAFKVRFAGGFGMLGMMQAGNTDQDAPVLLQKERLDYMSAFFRNKSAAELMKRQHEIMNAALDAGRPVYAIVTESQLSDFRRWFMTSDYQMTQLTHWLEPCGIHFPDDEIPGRPRIPGQERTLTLAPRVMSMQPIIAWQPQALSLQRIQRKPATQPTTNPTTPPATQPIASRQ